MPLIVRIRETVWESAQPLRQREWKELIRDLMAGKPLFELREGTMWIAREEERIALNFDDATDASIELKGLRAMLDEYIDVIHKLMDENASPPRVEALDMAKKVVHDSAAKKLSELLPDLTSDLEARRRLFSLIVALVFDTTKLSVAHRHH
jgi:hypothetical protein